MNPVGTRRALRWPQVVTGHVQAASGGCWGSDFVSSSPRTSAPSSAPAPPVGSATLVADSSLPGAGPFVRSRLSERVEHFVCFRPVGCAHWSTESRAVLCLRCRHDTVPEWQQPNALPRRAIPVCSHRSLVGSTPHRTAPHRTARALPPVLCEFSPAAL